MDADLSHELLEKLKQDCGPLQGISSAIAAELTELAGLKPAKVECVTDEERKPYAGFRRLQECFDLVKEDFDVVREKARNIIRAFDRHL